jgi:signal transduction histidine kinase
MSNKIKGLLILIILLIASTSIYCQDSHDAIRKNLQNRLAQNISYKERIQTLRNLMDLTPKKEGYFNYCNQLLLLGQRNKDINIQLEALRYYGNIGNIDSLTYYIGYVKRLPLSNHQRETLAFLRIQRAYIEIGLENGEKKSQNFQRLIRVYKQSKNDDIYMKTEKLFILCIGMSYYLQGNLYQNYIVELGKLISQLPEDGRSILPHAYCIYAANFYGVRNMHKEAVYFNKKIISLLQQMEKENLSNGRIYRNYDIVYYATYSQMLTHHTILSKAEIENIYQHMQMIAKRNKDVAVDFNKPYSIEKIRYFMATKRYKEAYPYLQNYFKLTVHNELVYRKECLKYNIEVAQALHKNDDLIKSSLEYINLLEQDSQNALAEKSKELQVVYDVNSLQQRVTKLDLEKKEEQIKTSRKINQIYLMSLVLLVVLFGVTFYLLLRSKDLARHLQRSKEQLQNDQVELTNTMEKLVKARDQAEVANRMKTMFIQNMNHEIRTPLNVIVGFSQILVNNRNELSTEDQDKYENLITTNCDLLLTLINDVLDIARMESGDMEFHFDNYSLNKICKMAVETVKPRTAEGVNMYFRQHDKDMVVHTDRDRTEQVLINFLTNAAKFTKEGEIVLDYETDLEKKEIILSVTDTGKGIPANKKDNIFQRFVKLDSFTQGTGLGLHICTLIAKQLKGEVKLDTSYTNGSRFLFILPFESDKQ